MNDDAAAFEAIDSLNGKDFDGRTLRINEAKPRENNGSRDNRPRRNFNDRY